MFNMSTWSLRGPSSNASLKRLKHVLGAAVSLMLLLFASVQSEHAVQAAESILIQNESGTTLEGTVIVAQGDEIPEGTEAWLVSDKHSGPIDGGDEEASPAVKPRSHAVVDARVP